MGAAGSSGWFPINNDIPLFMARENSSAAHRLNLYLKATESGFNSMGLVTDGIFKSNSGISMYIDGDAININNTTKLYSHGF